MNKEYLVCTGCQKEYALDRVLLHCCDYCFKPLQVKIFPPQTFNKKKIYVPENILTKYNPFYLFSGINNKLSLKEGFTSLIKANLLSQLLDLDYLYKTKLLNRSVCLRGEVPKQDYSMLSI